MAAGACLGLFPNATTAAETPTLSNNAPLVETEPFPARMSGHSRRGLRRRNRPIGSCLECRRRKIGCDRCDPCSRCIAGQRRCIYGLGALDEISLVKLKDMKDSLEQNIITLNDIPFDSQYSAHGPSRLPAASLPSMGGGADEGLVDERDLKPTPLAADDAAYDGGDGHEDDEDIWDLGFKLGQMRLNERVGGYFRPKIAEEIAISLEHAAMSLPDHGPHPENFDYWGGRPDLNDYMAPGPNFLPPRSDFMFGSSMQKISVCKDLPSKYTAEKLLAHYWVAVHPIARTVHRPSFEQRYRKLWRDVATASEPPASIAAIVFAVLFSAAVSISDDTTFGELGVSRESILEQLQSGTECALQRANVSRTTKTETFQALIIYLIPMCRDEISRVHTVMVGAAIRLAECMGLHRDPSEYGFSPIETHVRRLIWYQLCYLDLRANEVQGPRLSIRREGYTTKMPAEVDDMGPDIVPDSESTTDQLEWVDATFSRIRFECQEMERLCVTYQARLDKGSVRVTEVLRVIESFRLDMEARYGPMFKSPILPPIQRMASIVMSLMISRLYVMILHRYMNSVGVRIPDRLRQIVLEMGTKVLEDAVELETAPELRPWAWYCRAYQHYHTAFLLLYEVFAFPMRRQADRIWRCLDYVYEMGRQTLPVVDDSVSSRQDIIRERNQKASFILRMFVERMAEYRERRRIRVPVSMKESMILITPSRVGDESDPTLPLNYAHNDQGSKSSPENKGTDKSRCTSNTEGNFAIQAPLMADQTAFDMIARNLENNHPESQWHMNNILDGLTLNETAPQLADNLDHHAVNNRFHVEEQHLTAQFYTANTGASTLTLCGPEGEDQLMMDIDWNEWDALFPPHINDGSLDLSPMFLDTDGTAFDPFQDLIASNNFIL